MKVRVLVIADWFVPGFRAGGPIQSTVNFAEHMEGQLDIHILTTDRDLGMEEPYDGVASDRWLPRGAHRVFYASPSWLGWWNILGLIREIRPDHIYLNSMFSRYMTIYPLFMRRLGLFRAGILLAPRGMLMDSALASKTKRKLLFLKVLHLLGMERIIRFQVTNVGESEDVVRHFGHEARMVLISDFTARQLPMVEPPAKTPGMLRIAFVGRSHPIKNLDLLLEALSGIPASVELFVVVTGENPTYLEKCQRMAASLPANISVRFEIDIEHARVRDFLLSSHIFAMPTKGENFGHSIFEALLAGRPVLISDQTPWRRLEDVKAGWDITVESPEPLRRQLARIADMGDAELRVWCEGAWQHARRHQENTSMPQTFIEIFTKRGDDRPL